MSNSRFNRIVNVEDPSTLSDKIISLLIEHLNECSDDGLLKLGAFIDYELRERDIKWVSAFEDEYRDSEGHDLPPILDE